MIKPTIKIERKCSYCNRRARLALSVCAIRFIFVCNKHQKLGWASKNKQESVKLRKRYGIKAKDHVFLNVTLIGRAKV